MTDRRLPRHLHVYIDPVQMPVPFVVQWLYLSVLAMPLSCSHAFCHPQILRTFGLTRAARVTRIKDWETSLATFLLMGAVGSRDGVGMWLLTEAAAEWRAVSAAPPVSCRPGGNR